MSDITSQPTINDFKLNISRVYPLEETYKLYCKWMKEHKHEPVESYKQYTEFVRKSPSTRVNEIKYCHESEFFTALTEKRNIRWIIGLCSNMKPKNQSDMEVFFGLDLV
jgi:Zn/Cd-binding protein ZinT